MYILKWSFERWHDIYERVFFRLRSFRSGNWRAYLVLGRFTTLHPQGMLTFIQSNICQCRLIVTSASMKVLCPQLTDATPLESSTHVFMILRVLSILPCLHYLLQPLIKGSSRQPINSGANLHSISTWTLGRLSGLVSGLRPRSSPVFIYRKL